MYYLSSIILIKQSILKKRFIIRNSQIVNSLLEQLNNSLLIFINIW